MTSKLPQPISYKKHLNISKSMSMGDRLDNEMISLMSYEDEAKKLLRAKLGFWKHLFLINKLTARIHIASCLFYNKPIIWEHLEVW